MPTVYEGIGTEALADAVFITLRNEFSGALSFYQQKWQEYDAELAGLLGVAASEVAIEMEPVEPGNFHVGDLPSFIQSNDRAGRYPLVAVVPGTTVRDSEQADQYSILVNTIDIHCFARCAPLQGADDTQRKQDMSQIAYRRGERMMEAVHYVVNNDQTLSRVLASVTGPESVTRSESWYFSTEEGHGEDWCWKAVMSTYRVKNYSQTPWTEV